MEDFTRALWEKQNQHPGDRRSLFGAVTDALGGGTVLYPGSYVDIAASFVFQFVTYVDSDSRTPRFFSDDAGVREIIAAQPDSPDEPEVRFVHGDYRDELGFAHESFDLLISLYAGFVSDACSDYLRIGGRLLVNSSHGDAALASIDPRYALSGVVLARASSYRFVTENLGTYLVPKSSGEVNRETILRAGRGIAYTKSAFAYVFERIS